MKASHSPRSRSVRHCCGPMCEIVAGQLVQIRTSAYRECGSNLNNLGDHMTAPATPTVLALAPEAQDLLFRQARTANTFTDDPVTDEQIEAIYDLVKYAPTSLNIQPLRVVLLRSPRARARLLPHL